MVYKKFEKKGDKIFGPYYYESYRDGDKVKKNYIGGEKEYKIWLKKKEVDNHSSGIKNLVEQPHKFKSNQKLFLFIFLGILIFLILSGFIFFMQGFNNKTLKFTGFLVSENITDDVNERAYLSYEKETVEQRINLSNLDLEIRAPEESGDIISKNKNKRLDFTLEEGKIRLYFDLLNYSEFVENIAEQIVLENATNLTRVVEINVSQTLVNITNITEIETNATIIETNATISETNVTNVTIPETNATINETLPSVNETNVTIPSVNETTNIINETVTETNETVSETAPETEVIKPEENLSSEEPASQEPAFEEPVSNEQTSEQSITGNMIKNAFKFTGSMINSFVAITSRVIGIDMNESLSENQTNVTQVNFSQTNQIQEYSKVSLEQVKESLNELSSDEVGQLIEDVVVSAENFDIIVNETQAQENPPMKWGYKVRLNDLKFMAKIVVTTNESISIYSSDSLRIGRRNILSFADLASAGYKVRFVTPALEIPVESISVGVNVTEIIQEIVMNASNVSDANEIVNESEAVNESELSLGNESEIVNETNVAIDETIAKESQKQEENKTDNENKKEKEDKEKNKLSQEQTGYGISGNVVRFITGITGRIISGFIVSEGQTEIDDIKYSNTITVYIEKDFNQIENSLEFSSYQDLDSDGKLSIGDIIDLDPTLIIIPATDAEHLDLNRSFISNIYEQIKSQDNNWSESIPALDFVRVVFSQALDRTKDITIFARSADYNNETNSSVSSNIEVYRKDSDVELARFENITIENWYKVYLDGLSENESYDTFDLRIVNNPVLLDYIVDPTPGATNVSNCLTLSSANTYYQLNTSISNNTVAGLGCIIISAANITFDCDGYSITSTSNNSGVYSNKLNTTVKNCNISMGQGNNTESLGIELTDAADYSIIYNNTVWDYGVNGMYYGIVTNAENQNITNNNINVSCVNCRAVLLSAANDNELRSNIGVSNSNYGIYLSSSNNNILINNTARSESSHGFYILSSDNTTFYNNTGITASSSTSTYSIYFYYADNCTLDYNIGISTTGSALTMLRCLSNVVSHQNSSGGARAVLLQQTNHTIIEDCINVSGTSYSFRSAVNATNNTVLNCSYNSATESLTDNSELIRKWYYQAYVNDSFGTAINNANVSAYNSSSNLEFSYLTNSSGWINRTEITEYKNTGGTRQYYSNYTINASADGFSTVNQTLNITIVNNSLEIVFTLTDSAGTNITVCRDLSSANTVYTLINNVTANGTCLSVSAENITIDCAGYNITGNTTGFAVNATGSSASKSEYNFTVKNCTIRNFSSAIRADGWTGGYGGYGGGGGNVNVSNSNIFSNIDSSGVDASAGENGGDGGSIYITSSNVTAINSNAGDGGTGGNGGNGGTIYLSNSNSSSISSDGGSRGTGGGRSGGSVTLVNSKAITITSSGAGGYGGYGGYGGTINLTDSNVTSISHSGAVGGDGTDVSAGYSGGNGGTAIILRSNVSTITNIGGNGGVNADCAANAAGEGGRGGNIYINNSNVTTINNYGGSGGYGLSDNGPGGNGNSAGTIIIINSSVTTINIYGGSGGSGGNDNGEPPGAGGFGGNLSAINLSVITINDYGGNAGAPGSGGYGNGISGGSGGNINLSNSSFRVIKSYGIIGAIGTSTYGPGGSGGTIYINNASLNLTNVIINISKGLRGGAGATNGTTGNLTINFSSNFVDTNASYGTDLKLFITNTSLGIIDFMNNEINGIGLSNLSTNIIFKNNSVYVNSTRFSALNKSANVTLFGIGDRGYENPSILRDGTFCGNCVNFTSLTASTVMFNVSYWSNYSIGDYSETNITINSGWNLVSFQMKDRDTGTVRNVSVASGRNIIGFSANSTFDLSSVNFTNNSGSTFTWAEAVANNKVQAYLAYYDSAGASMSDRKYKYAATSDLSMDDTLLRAGKGYIIDTNQAGNLTLPSVGGAYSNATFNWADLRVSNGTVELNITEAGNATNDWLEISGNNKFKYWNNGWETVCDSLIDCDSTTFSSWKGYFIWCNKENITLIRRG